MNNKALEEDIQRIIESRHNQPQSVLGPHYMEKEKLLIIRIFHPHAKEVHIQRKTKPYTKYKMEKIHEDGLFEAKIEKVRQAFKYKVIYTFQDGNTYTTHDPYAFKEPEFTEFDRYLFLNGKHYKLFEKFGAHPMVKDGVKGVNFILWAPNAQRVSVVGPFNLWDGRIHQMMLLDESGIWELFIPDLGEAEVYQYEMKIEGDIIFKKTDPFSFYTAYEPLRGGVIRLPWEKYRWKDEKWMKDAKKENSWKLPLNIYKMDVSKEPLDDLLIKRIKDEGYNYIELSPYMGDKIDSFFSPNTMKCIPEELMTFIDRCHNNNIGLILTSIPSIISEEAKEMTFYDGTRLYEYEDTTINKPKFNHERKEVRSFLISNSMFWMEKYHFDGVNIDPAHVKMYKEALEEEGDVLKDMKVIANGTITERSVSEEEIKRIVEVRHSDPHSILGPHKLMDGNVSVRTFYPGAKDIYLLLEGTP
ncbi:MAG: hypothetical protein D6828_06830, partial [Nitrospirae bacterium]